MSLKSFNTDITSLSHIKKHMEHIWVHFWGIHFSPQINTMEHFQQFTSMEKHTTSLPSLLGFHTFYSPLFHPIECFWDKRTPRSTGVQHLEQLIKIYHHLPSRDIRPWFHIPEDLNEFHHNADTPRVGTCQTIAFLHCSLGITWWIPSRHLESQKVQSD